MRKSMLTEEGLRWARQNSAQVVLSVLSDQGCLDHLSEKISSYQNPFNTDYGLRTFSLIVTATTGIILTYLSSQISFPTLLAGIAVLLMITDTAYRINLSGLNRSYNALSQVSDYLSSVQQNSGGQLIDSNNTTFNGEQIQVKLLIYLINLSL